MGAPRAGGHVWIRERFLPTVRAFYPDVELNKDTVLLVVGVPKAAGDRARVFVRYPGRVDPMVLWPVHVTAFPRCEYCDQEGHTKSRATAKNCEVVRKEQEEERAAKREAATRKKGTGWRDFVGAPANDDSGDGEAA